MNKKYFFFLMMVLIFSLIVSACGHKGDPNPPKEMISVANIKV